MKKKLCYLLIIALIFSCIPVISSEAASKKSQVNSAVKGFLNATKKFDANKMNKYVKSWGKCTKPSTYNSTPYMKKYFKWANKKLSYKILSTKASGKTAKVKVRVKYTNSKEFTDTFYGLLVLDLMGRDNPDKLSDKQTLNLFNKYSKIAYFDAIKSKRKYKTETITITLGKYGKNWKIKKMSKRLENIIYANYPYCMDHFWDE